MRYILYILCFLSLDIIAQVDTSVYISPVLITPSDVSKEESMMYGAKIIWSKEELDSIAPSSMAELLSRHANIYIKNYGPSSIATATIRGASSSQLSTLWNGMPLQSPMLGLIDIALLSPVMCDRIQVNKGNHSTLHGSGAIGGSIVMESADLRTQPMIRFALGGGSFGQRDGSFSWTTQVSKKLYHRIRASYDGAENNIIYKIKDTPKELTHARHRALHIMDDWQWQINPRSSISLRYWGAFTHRLIPPRTVQTRSHAEQKDTSQRIGLEYHYTDNNYRWESRLGYSREHIHYSDMSLVVPSQFSTVYSDVALSKQLDYGLWKVKGSHMYTQAYIKNYTEAPKEHRYALLGYYESDLAFLRYRIALRQEINNKKYVHPIPSFRVGKEWKSLSGFIAGGSVYRYPTFNDRYWNPGGNPDTRPESGWEVSTDWTHTFGGNSCSISVFSRWVEDWILWAPLAHTSLWSVQNIAAVWSRGLEVSDTYTWGRYTMHTQYAYTRSTHEKALQTPSIPQGTQLWYTPIHTVTTGHVYNFGAFDVSYTHTYHGETQGINKNLASYHLGNLKIRGTYATDMYRVLAYVEAKNIWNTSYRLVEQRPMPLRHFRMGITINYLKLKKSL